MASPLSTTFQRLEVDVVLMDIRMPGIDGVETTRRIRASDLASSLRILILTTFEADENVLAAVRAGADGFFSKGAAPTEITDGILRVFEGDRALSRAALNAVVGHISDEPTKRIVDPELTRLFDTLTTREREVVALIVDGLDNAQIAERAFISPFTVKTHASRAMTKVGARDRAHLVSLAVRASVGGHE